jgi:hypothetical protein
VPCNIIEPGIPRFSMNSPRFRMPRRQIRENSGVSEAEASPWIVRGAKECQEWLGECPYHNPLSPAMFCNALDCIRESNV